MHEIKKLLIVKRLVSIILGIVLAFFIYAHFYGVVTGGYTFPLEATMFISILVFLVLWNITKSKLVHLLHIIPILCVAIPEIKSSAKYEQEFKNDFEDYVGYYIRAHDPNDIHIVKLSLDGHLILQPMVIVENELVEDGKKIVLNRHYIVEPERIRFGTAWHSKNNTSVILYKNWGEAEIEYHAQTGESFRLDYSSRSTFADSFTRDASDILKLYNSVLSLHVREKHTGTFAFHDYEVIDIYNRENPLPELMNEKIIVELNEEGFLIANHRPNAENKFWGTMQFRVQDNSQRISFIAGCGLYGFNSRETYQFINENTILYEFFRVSFPSGYSPDYPWLAPDYYERLYNRLHYRIVFKREGVVESI